MDEWKQPVGIGDEWTQPKRDVEGGELFLHYKRRVRGEYAAWLRARGWSWRLIAGQVGLASPGAAINSAKRFGRPEVVARWRSDG